MRIDFDRIHTSELLSGGRRMSWSGTGVGQILELSLGVGELGLDLLSDRALWVVSQYHDGNATHEKLTVCYANVSRLISV